MSWRKPNSQDMVGGAAGTLGVQPGHGGATRTWWGCHRDMWGCSRDMRVAARTCGVQPGNRGCSWGVGVQLRHEGCSRGMGDTAGTWLGMQPGNWGGVCSRGTGDEAPQQAGTLSTHPMLALPGSATLSRALPAKAGTLSCSESQQALRSCRQPGFPVTSFSQALPHLHP